MSKFLSNYNDVTVAPKDVYRDPVEKIRVTQPQALMDTDFEYSLQGTKWETTSMMNNIPSVFTKANEPSFTSTQISSILRVPGPGYVSSLTPINYAANVAPRGSLPLIVGSPEGSNYSGDDFNVFVSLPFNIQFLGQTYSGVYVGSNGYVTFGAGASSYSGWSPTFPALPIIALIPGDRTLTGVRAGYYNGKYVIAFHGGDCCNNPAQGNNYQLHFSPNSNQIDIITESFTVDAGVTPYISDGVTGVYAHQWSLANNTAYRFISAAGASKDVRVTVTAAPTPGFFAGQPIAIKESGAQLAIDGTYLIKSVPSANSFTITTNITPAPGFDYKSNYTTIYTGGFFSGSEVPISSVNRIAGTTKARINFSSPHAMFPGQTLYVVDSSQANANWVGTFEVSSVSSATSVDFFTNFILAFEDSSQLSTGTTLVYVRPNGTAQHRFLDGGVSLTPGGSTPNTQIIRQTRKYFRYQSGKGIEFSTGVVFRPQYDVLNLNLLTNVWTADNPFFELAITLEQDHGFGVPDAFRPGATVKLIDFEVNSGTSPFSNSTEYQVANVVNSKTFVVKIPSPSLLPVFLGITGNLKVQVVGWSDATVRTGMFDDQNGMFFEHDGNKVSVVRRHSVDVGTGLLSCTRNSSTITGTGTKFLNQLREGDYIVIKGCSYMITTINSDTSATIQPDFRTPSETNLKFTKTQEIRVSQGDFSVDNLDGTGPTGYVLDPNTMQMIFMDYSWYGAGKIRYGIRTTNGEKFYFHEMPQNNINTHAYMRSGNLPARFEIQNRSKRCVLRTALTTSSTTLQITDGDASQLPSPGRIVINYETIQYTKGASSGGLTTLNLTRNENGLSSPATASIGDNIWSFNQNCGPTLNHWGVSVIMDGMFDVDKSYLFTASNASAISISANQELPVMSIRLAPSVDNGIGREFGIRNLINRSAITLNSIGLSTTGSFAITAKINAESTQWNTISNWTVAGNGSISQFLDHSVRGTSPFPVAGDIVVSFFADPGTGSSPATTTKDIAMIRDLGNSILGGDKVYPDGPDILTIYARNVGSSAATLRSRISWTEAQG